MYIDGVVVLPGFLSVDERADDTAGIGSDWVAERCSYLEDSNDGMSGHV